MKKSISLLLAVMMVLTLFVGMVPAASAEGSTDAKNIVLNKTAKLESDGTYTINLEAYATGTVISGKKDVPTDIIMVLDTSGSMDTKDFVSKATYSARARQDYSYSNANDKGYYYLFNGVYYEVHGAYSNGGDWRNSYSTWLYFDVGSTRYYLTGTGNSASVIQAKDNTNPDPNNPPLDVNNKPINGVYNDNGIGSTSKSVWTGVLYTKSTTKITRLKALQDAANAFIDSTAEKNKSIANPNEQHRISIISFASSASKLADRVIASGNNITSLHSTINGLSADGATRADLGLQEANALTRTITTNSPNRNTVVIFFTDGYPTKSNGLNCNTAVSAITQANEIKGRGTVVYSISVLEGANPAVAPTSVYDSGNNDVIMNGFMNAVSSNYPNATANFSNNYINFTYGIGSNAGFYKIASNSSELDNVFSEIENNTGATSVSLDSNAVLKDIIGDGFTLPNGASSVTVKTAKHTGDSDGKPVFGTPTAYSGKVTVSGNDVSVSNFSYKDNYVVTVSNNGTTEYNGSKLMVEIKGIVPTDDAAIGLIPTNKPGSGIYASSSEIVATAKFPQPQVPINQKTYVIDYAKSITVNASDWGQKNIKVYGSFTKNAVNQIFGTVSNTNSSIIYTPTTMNWTGVDSEYSLGTSTSSSDYTWAKVNFVPANNVYYEDDFATISYSYNDTWTTDGTSTNQQEFANSIHGGVDNSTLVDDTTYSGGSAHKAVASKDKLPSASFTFTGTGVDVYSRTNSATGTVMAVLSGTSNDVNKVMTVDNLLKQGKDFYQVPTVSFADLPYGTYIVTIYVSTAAGDRVTYYLDGVRVYNPTQDTTLYDVSERNAQFVEVRDRLIVANDFGVKEGIVFTDNGNASDVATYKKYGPENEVYLAKGQAIMFQVNNVGSGTDYYIGMSAPEGSATAKMTNGASASEPTVGHASDLYYKVTPNADGFVRIENTGDNMLAISKLRVAGEVPVTLFAMAKAPMMSYANSFSTLSVVPYEEEAVDPVVDPTDPIVDPIVDPEPTPDPEPTHTSIFENLFKFIKNLFSWR